MRGPPPYGAQSQAAGRPCVRSTPVAVASPPKSLATTVATPSKWPRRCCPSIDEAREGKTHPGVLSRRIHEVDPGSEHHVGPSVLGKLQVTIDIAGIAVQVAHLIELERIDEQAHEHSVVLRRGSAEQRRMTLVQVPHRGDQTDGAHRERTAFGEGGCDFHDGGWGSASTRWSNCSLRPDRPASSATNALKAPAQSGDRTVTVASWASTVATSPRATGPVRAARGPSSNALATTASTRGRAASKGEAGALEEVRGHRESDERKVRRSRSRGVIERLDVVTDVERVSGRSTQPDHEGWHAEARRSP